MTTYFKVFYDYVVIVNENNDIISMYHYKEPSVKCLPFNVRKQEFVHNLGFYNFRTQHDRGIVVIKEVPENAGKS